MGYELPSSARRAEEEAQRRGILVPAAAHAETLLALLRIERLLGDLVARLPVATPEPTPSAIPDEPPRRTRRKAA